MLLRITSLPGSNHFRVLVLLLMTLPLSGGEGAPVRVPGGDGDSANKTLEAGSAFEVRCTDGSVMKLRILDEKCTLQTPYGKLFIPVANINEIEFATRIPDDVARKVALAIVDLGHGEFKKREEATAELAKLQIKAYPALLKAEKLKDPEVLRRTKLLLEKIRKGTAEEDLTVRDRDVVQTDDSKIAGRIEAATFRVASEQFGEVRLKVSDIRHLRSLSIQKDEKQGPALPDPGHLHGYLAQVGKTFSFTVTGVAVGSVWGTDFYTLDSSLAAASVHAGVAKIGKTVVVKVRILPARVGFQGTARNGVVTTSYTNYPGAFEFVKEKE